MVIQNQTIFCCFWISFHFTTMVDITALNHDLWYYISMNFLKFQEFQNLTQCNKYLNQMQWIDIIWKRYCQEDHKIQYKHPDQSYRDLYLQCKKRRACHHLQKVAIDVPKDLRTAWKDQNRCGRCDVEGIENLYICLSPGCHEICKLLYIFVIKILIYLYRL